MVKQKRKMKNRSATPDSPEIFSPNDRAKIHGSSSPRGVAEIAYHVESRIRSRSPSHMFEISDSPEIFIVLLYLHSSDHLGMILAPELLDGTNYGTWIVAMMTSIGAKNKDGFVDGSILKPLEDDLYCKIWRRCNSMVKSWLLNSVSKNIYTTSLYSQRLLKYDMIYKLRQQIHSFRQGSLDLSSYHTQTQSLWEQLSSLQVTPRIVEDLLVEREINRVIDFLVGLNGSYDTVRSQILIKKSLPFLSEVYNMLDQDEYQKSARLSSTTSDSMAFQVSQQPSQRYGVTGGRSSSAGTQYFQVLQEGYKPPICSFCCIPGHVMECCNHKHGYPVGFKGKKRFQSPCNI